MLTSRVYLVASFLTAVAIQSSAHAVVLCARPKADGSFSSTVKIREACRPTETQLDAAALGLQGPPGTTGPTGPSGPPGVGLVVLDSDNALVGVLAAPGIAVRDVLGQAVAFRVFDSGFDTDDSSILFEVADCQGSPWLAVDGNGRNGIPPFFVMGSFSQGRGFFRMGAFETRTMQSRLQTAPDMATCAAQGGVFTPPDRCCRPFAAPLAPVAPAAEFDVTTLGLVPPFRVVLQ